MQTSYRSTQISSADACMQVPAADRDRLPAAGLNPAVLINTDLRNTELRISSLLYYYITTILHFCDDNLIGRSASKLRPLLVILVTLLVTVFMVISDPGLIARLLFVRPIHFVLCYLLCVGPYFVF